MPTTGQSSRINRHVCESGVCGGSSQPGKRSDSWVFMLRFTIYSTLVGIWYQRSITEVSGQVRFHVGQRQWSKDELLVFSDLQKLTWQYRLAPAQLGGQRCLRMAVLVSCAVKSL